MAVRREKVILELEDHFSTQMAKAAAATKLVDRELHGLSGRSLDFGRASGTASRDIDRFSSSLRHQGAEVDRFSGRVRILADTLAVLGPSLVPVGGVAAAGITGLSSQLGFAAIGMGSLVAASQGVGDALKAVNEAALEPTTANLEKAREAMDQLGPAAQTFVTRFQELRPVLRDIRDASAAGWFPGITEALDSVERVGPEVADLFENIGRAGGQLLAEGAAAFAGPGWADFRQFIAIEGPRALTELGHSVGNVARGLAELWMAFGPLNSSFSSWLLDASRGFAEWADGLAATEGFQEFISYIQTNGPKVADALVAVGTAVVDIIEAIAPLGGPSLQIIESFAKVIGAIADSDLGTPILAGVAALAALNRTLQLTAAIEAKMTGSSALGAGLAKGGLRGGLRALNTDAKSTLASVGKVTAALGGLTIATTGVADGIGLSNTASLALMGTLGGPWGVAIGAGAGALMDLSSALDVSTSSVATFNAAMASGNPEQMIAEIRAIEQELASLSDISGLNSIGDFAKGSKLVLQDAFANIGLGDFADTTADLKQRESVLEGQVEASQRAALAEAGFSDAVRETAEAAGFTTAQLLALAEGTEQTSAAAWGAFDAQTRLGAAMDGLAEAASKGKRGLDETTEGGRENRMELSNAAASWAEAKRAMEENGAATEDVEARYRGVRRALVEAAIKMGATKREARELAAQLDKPMSLVVKDKSQAAVASAKAAIADLRRSIEGKPIIQTVEVKRRYGKDATVGAPGGLPELFGGGTGADGTTVPKTGLPYADRHLYMLADGERVTSNRHGQVDKSRKALDLINNGLLNDRILGLADGGTTGKSGKRSKNLGGVLVAPGWGAFADFDQLPRSLKDFVAGLEKSRDKLEAEADARQSLITELGDTIGGRLTSQLFGETNPWSAGGFLTDAVAILNGDTAGANAFSSNVARLQALGLDEPDALNTLLSQADAATIANIAATATPEVIAQYEQSFQARQAAVTNAQNVAMAAQTAALTAEMAASRAELVGIKAEIKALQQVTKGVGPSAGKATADANNKGASKAAHSRIRSGLTP